MKNWTIAKRIIAGGATLLALLLVVSIGSIFGLSKLEAFAGSRLRDDAIPCMVHSAEITTQSLRGYIRLLMAGTEIDAAKRNDDLKRSEDNFTEARKAMEAYGKLINNPEDRALFDELQKRMATFDEQRASYNKLLKEGSLEEASILEHTKLEPAYLSLREQAAKMLAWNQKESLDVSTEMTEVAKSTRTTAATFAAISIALATVLGWLIIRGTNRVLQHAATTLDDAASQVAAAAAQVSVGSQHLAEGASEQAASLEETSSSLEELSSMTKRNADGAVSAKSLSGETRSAAEEGNNDMAEMRQAMDAIKVSSDDIAKIIKTIDEIAFQTNILALNAAVEAARAGEAGAGFAVVADEVRSLAQRSATSAKETASKIEVAIQNSDHGVRISEKVAASLGVITSKARGVDELVGEIATASSEQSDGIGQISTAVSQMDKVTQSNASNAEETAAAAEELTAQSAALKDTVRQLRELVGGKSESNRPTPAGNPPAASRHAAAPAKAAPPRNTSSVISTRPSPVTTIHHKTPAPASAAADGDKFFKDV